MLKSPSSLHYLGDTVGSIRINVDTLSRTDRNGTILTNSAASSGFERLKAALLLNEYARER